MTYQQDTEVTRVIFRTFKGKDGGDVIALFPDLSAGRDLIESYQHAGQHSGASPSVVHNTRPATPAEIEPLRRELESAPFGYRLQLLKRFPRRR